MADEIREELRESFADREYRHLYSASFLNTSIAAQIKALRDALGWTQEELGQRAGMRQESISRLENVNYSGWSISTLRRLAEAFDLALVVKFESFGNLLNDITRLNKLALLRPAFADDPAFQSGSEAQGSAPVGSVDLPLAPVAQIADYYEARAVDAKRIKGRSMSSQTRAIDFGDDPLSLLRESHG